MKMKMSLLSLIVATLLAAGCGGSGGSSSTPDPTPTPDPGPEATASTGVLLDSPVAGIQYRTATKSGVTNANGEYEYVAGETVVFFIGDLEFPPVEASGVVTPVDIAAGNDTMQTNILQILQTLDSDGNPDNGITIYEEAATAFAGADLDLTSEAFDVEVTSVLDTIGAGIDLITEDDATAHFEKSQKSQILGSWDISEDDGNRNVLTFIDEERYIIIHEFEEAGENQPAGSVEYGTYTWDTTTGAFEVSLIEESDGFGGLWDEKSNWTTAAVLNDTLTLHLSNDGEELDVNFTRIPNPVDSLVGAYIFTEAGTDSIHVLTFLSETEYVIAHNQNQESYSGEDVQALSGEFGTYSYDPNSQSFVVMMGSVDTDGEGGLHNAAEASDQANEFMRFTEKGHLAFFDQDEDTVYFERITGLDVPTPKVPEAFTKEWLQGKTLYPVWYGEGEDANDDPIFDVPVAGKITFNADGTYTGTGLLNHMDEAGNYMVLPSGLLVFDDEPDYGNTIVCGSTPQYIKTHYTEYGAFNNVDLVFFDEAEAMTYAYALTDSIAKCDSAKPISYTQSDLTGKWYSTGTITPNNNGAVATNTWAESGTMTVASDGVYSWTTTDDSDNGTLTFLDSEKGTLTNLQPSDHLGWFMNAGKDVITLVFNNNDDGEQGTITWVKAADTYAPSDLTGTWYSMGVVTPNKTGSVDNYWANAATMTIETNGGFEWTAEDPVETGTLSISTAGLVNDGDPNTDVLGWYMNAGKDVMTLVFDDTTDNEQGTFTFVKKSDALYTQADLIGTWHSVGTITPSSSAMGSELTANYWAEAGTMTIDDGGSYSWKTNDDEDNGTLTLSAEGEITEDGTSDVLGWYLSAGKDVMTLVFNNTTDHEQGIITFVKQK